MAMTYEEFEKYSKYLVKISQELDDGWKIETCFENNKIYLVKTQINDNLNECKQESYKINHSKISKESVISKTNDRLVDKELFKTLKENKLIQNETETISHVNEYFNHEKLAKILDNDIGISDDLQTLYNADKDDFGNEKLTKTLDENIKISNDLLTVFNTDKGDSNNEKPAITLNENIEISDDLLTVYNADNDDSNDEKPAKIPDEHTEVSDDLQIYNADKDDSNNELAKTLEENIEINYDLQTVYNLDKDNFSMMYAWTYHILYSFSYEVPVMYFNVFDSNGRLLNLEEIWRLTLLKQNGGEQTNNWMTLTQIEHPYLRIPFYQLHPCRTKQLIEIIATQVNSEQSKQASRVQASCMNVQSDKGASCMTQVEQCKEASCNKLIAWISCVAPYVHLEFSLDYGLGVS